MLKREDLTSENIDQIVADAHKAGYHFFLSAEEREASFKAAMARYQPGEEVWVFAYGSLMWNPAHRVRRAAALSRRRLAPLLLLLDADGPRHARAARPDAGARAGGACEGIAYRLAPQQVESELGLLWNREMLAGIYQPPGCRRRCATAAPSPPSPSWSTPAHCQYCGDLPIERAAHHIAFAEGRRGACRDYLANTAAHARALHIHDPYIEELVERVSTCATAPTSIPTVQTDGEAVGEA